jgi:sarcosine oxidase
LFETTGVVNHGGVPDFARAAVQRAAGIPAEVLSAREAEERWPGIRFATDALFHTRAGRLDADAAVSALQQAAAARGAAVRHESPVESIEVRADEVVVRTAGEAVTARVAVVAVGAWTAKLLGGLLPLPPLRVTQEQPAYFAPRSAGGPWPGFNHLPRPEGDEWWPAQIYGMDTPGFGIKAGWHGAGPVVDPDERTFRPEPAQLALLQRYVREWLPGADAEAVAPISCTYTTTSDHDFVIDRRGPLVVAAGFSGHGFKFTPAVGELLARLATEDAAVAPEAFRLDR